MRYSHGQRKIWKWYHEIRNVYIGMSLPLQNIMAKHNTFQHIFITEVILQLKEVFLSLAQTLWMISSAI